MPGVKTRIGRKAVSAMQRGDWINDDTLPGFKVRRPKKLALYGVNLRLNGRMRWITIGSEADFTPDQARGEAERIRGLKRQGQDPAADRDRRKAGSTVALIAGRFLKTHVETKLRASTGVLYADVLHRLILPEFGHWRPDAISTADIAAWHDRGRAAPTQANRALAILSSIFNWARNQNLYDGENPCSRVTRYREGAVNRYPVTGQIARMLSAADELASENAISIYFAAGLRVLALTGARRSEVFSARWAWLDTQRGDLVLPDSKTGAKRIALPTAAWETIDRLPRIEGCPFIFPSFSRKGRRYAPFVNFVASWSRVIERAGVGHWRIHDLRHGFASAAVEGGAPLYTVGQLLGHARPITTQRYAHISDDPKRAVVEAVAGAIGGK